MRGWARIGLIVAVGCGLGAAAQGPTARWGSYNSLGVDRVDRSSLAVQLDIPIYTRPTVGNAQINLQLVYDSQFWQRGAAWTPAAGNGWQLVSQAGASITTSIDFQYYCGLYDINTGDDPYTGNPDDESVDVMEKGYSLTEPDGTVTATAYLYEYLSSQPGRKLGWASDCPTSFYNPTSYIVPDGKGFTLGIDSSGNASAYDRAGDRIDAGFTDPNGNSVTESGGYFYDPLGNALVVSGSATPGSYLTYLYTGPGGTSPQLQEDFQSYPVSTDYFCSGISEFDGTLTLPSDLKLPDGSRYTFGYAADGRLASVTLPTGGTISYSYSSVNCSDLGNDALARGESLDSGKTWNWTRTFSGGYPVTTETTPYGDQAVYTFGAPLSTAPGDVLEGVAEYKGAAGGTELASLSLANTLSGGAVAQQVATTELYGATNLYAVKTATFDAYGDPTGETDTDWGPTSAGGATLRQVASSFVPAGMGIKPYQVTVKDGGGTLDSEATFAYDGKGNLLTEDDSTGGSSYLQKSWTYNANGTVATATDSNGAATTYTYGACSGKFPTLIQSAVAAVKTSATWDCTGGVPLTATDANSLTTTTAYADPSHTWRPTSITAPDGSVTSISYPSANQVERAMTFDGSSSTDDVLTTLDGLGRPILSQRRQGPGSSSFDTVQTGYDAMDRVDSVSMPFAAAAGATGGTVFTTTSYDALSRPLLVTDGGGGTVGYSYTD
ncbi:MAG TPA: hypothetical protein VMV31_01330, partial [Terriglobales bacterium]|nr:hypothetical protein [Terriglobales bacterium]